ncbi:MAG: hypothetical protein ACM3PE_07390 [Deltaproteobacteria bacterium]
MAQKKRLGKDPFANKTPASDPQPAAPTAKEPKIKAAPAQKTAAAKKTTSSSAAPEVKTPAPAPSDPKVDKPVAVVKDAVSGRDAEIESIRRELAELQTLVLKLQQQMEAMRQWNETLISPWQWWFSFFS